MKRKLCLLLTMCLTLAGCGSTTSTSVDLSVSDGTNINDMSTEEAIKYAQDLFSESVKDSDSPDELLDNMIDNAIKDFTEEELISPEKESIIVSELQDVEFKDEVTPVEVLSDTFDGITYASSGWSVRTYREDYMNGSDLDLSTYSIRNLIRSSGSTKIPLNSDEIETDIWDKTNKQIVEGLAEPEPWNGKVVEDVLPEGFAAIKNIEIDAPVTIDSMYEAGFFVKINDNGKVEVRHPDGKDFRRSFELAYKDSIYSEFENGYELSLEEAKSNCYVIFYNRDYTVHNKEFARAARRFGEPDYMMAYWKGAINMWLGYELEEAYLITNGATEYFFPKTEGYRIMMEHFFCDEENETEVIGARSKIHGIRHSEDSGVILDVEFHLGTMKKGDTVTLIHASGKKEDVIVKDIVLENIDNTILSSIGDGETLEELEYTLVIGDQISKEDAADVLRVMKYGSYECEKPDVQGMINYVENENAKELEYDAEGNRVPIAFSVNGVHELSTGDIVISGELKEGTLAVGDTLTIVRDDGSYRYLAVKSLDEGKNENVEIATAGNRIGIHLLVDAGITKEDIGNVTEVLSGWVKLN